MARGKSTDQESRPLQPEQVVTEASRSPRAGLDPQKRSRTLHHENLQIAGRDVEVTEDEIGIAEMHLA